MYYTNSDDATKLLLDTIPKYNALGYTVDLLLLWNDNHQFTESLIKQNVCNVYHYSHLTTCTRQCYSAYYGSYDWIYCHSNYWRAQVF